MIAIIGGSGMAKLVGLTEVRREIARTPWGDPSCALTRGALNGAPIIFLARHGYGHTVPPHEINYRANIWALKEAGATRIIAVGSVGGIRADMGPGELMVPDQLIDYTHGRANTYFGGGGQPVVHADFTEPYAAELRTRLLDAAASAGERVVDGGCYGCTQGPRLETAAEIRRMQRDGCDVVGMTGMPEAVLARELEIPYAALCVSANDAAGVRASRASVDLDHISNSLDQAMGRVVKILELAVAA